VSEDLMKYILPDLSISVQIVVIVSFFRFFGADETTQVGIGSHRLLFQSRLIIINIQLII
jgi:hypothetical protein